MRIGILSQEMFPLMYGGMGVQMSLLARFLVEIGHEVEFFTKKSDSSPADGGGVRAEWRTEYVQVEHASHYLPTISYAKAVDTKVCKRHQEAPFDLLFTVDFGGESFFLQMEPLIGTNGKPVPIVMTVHGASRDVNEANVKQSGVDDEVICLQEEIALACSSLCILPSHEYMKRLFGRLNLNEMPVRVIPNFYDDNLFAPQASSRQFQTPPFQIVYVGRLHHSKGVDLLVEAFRTLVRTYPEAELHLVGRDLWWDEYGDSFVAHWKKVLPAEILSRVFFHGNKALHEVREQLNSAYVAVFPSRFETFGIAALEAMSIGVPVIGTAGTGLAEVVGVNDELLVSCPPTAEKLAEAISRLLQDSALRARVSMQGIARAQAMLAQSKREVQSVLSAAQSGLLQWRGMLPGSLVRKLEMLLWEHGARAAEMGRAETSALACEIELRDKLILAEEKKILQRDDEIRKRDERIAAQQKEIHQLMQRLGKRG